MIIRAFPSFILLCWVTSVYCSFPCLYLLQKHLGQALGSSGQAGCGTACWGSTWDPRWWEQFSQNTQCEAPLLSLLLLLLVLIFLLLILLLPCTEIPTLGFFPNRNTVPIFEGNQWTKQAVGQKSLNFRVEWSSWMGRSLGMNWEQSAAKVLKLEALNLSERCQGRNTNRGGEKINEKYFSCPLVNP